MFKVCKSYLGGLMVITIILTSIFSVPASPANAQDFPIDLSSPETNALKNESQAADDIGKTQRVQCWNALVGSEGLVKNLTQNFGCAFLEAISTLIDTVLFTIWNVAAKFFAWVVDDVTLKFLDDGSPIQAAVKSGYPIVLGVANMFFVLLLLWIAIATIFDFEPYTARQLLPVLVVTALLINFSLPIARAFIGLSNGIADIFYTQLKRGATEPNISSAIRDIMSPVDLQVTISQLKPSADGTSAVEQKCNNAKCIDEKFAKKTAQLALLNGQKLTVSALQCAKKDPKIYDIASNNGRYTDLTNLCAQITSEAASDFNLSVQTTRVPLGVFATSIVWRLIIYPIATFAVFAAAIILLIRVVSLSFVLVLGPAAFLFNILPSTKFLNKMWWDRLMKWSFFFPSFMFLFWLSLMIAKSVQHYSGETLNGYTAMGPYFMSIAFMLGSIMVSSQFGIMGASTVTGWGKKMSKATGKWTRDRGWKYAGKGTEKFMGSRVGQTLTKIPLVGSAVRVAGVATMKKGSAVEKKDTKFYADLNDQRLAATLGGMRAGSARRLWNSLDSSRKRKAGGELAELASRRGWEAAGGGTARAGPLTDQQVQAVQNQTNAIMQSTDAFKGLPQSLQSVVTEAARQSAGSLPIGATADAAAGYINQAVLDRIREQSAATGWSNTRVVDDFVSTLQSQAHATALKNAVGQAIPQPRAQPRADRVGDLESDFASFQEEFNEWRNQRST